MGKAAGGYLAAAGPATKIPYRLATMSARSALNEKPT